MPKREENREVAYLRDETQRRLIEFVRHHPTLNSKSRVIEIALEFYLALAAEYGLDDRWRPKVPLHDHGALAAEQPKTYTRGHPRQKDKGTDTA